MINLKSTGKVLDFETEEQKVKRQKDDLLRDPRYFHMSKEFAVGFDNDQVVFPKMDNFKFNQQQYHKALNYLKVKQAGEVRKRLSRSQMDRLYPTD